MKQSELIRRIKTGLEARLHSEPERSIVMQHMNDQGLGSNSPMRPNIADLQRWAYENEENHPYELQLTKEEILDLTDDKRIRFGDYVPPVRFGTDFIHGLAEEDNESLWKQVGEAIRSSYMYGSDKFLSNEELSNRMPDLLMRGYRLDRYSPHKSDDPETMSIDFLRTIPGMRGFAHYRVDTRLKSDNANEYNSDSQSWLEWIRGLGR